MNLQEIVMQTLIWLLNWPLMIYVVTISLFSTILLKGIQVTKIGTALKNTLFPKKSAGKGDMTPLQAFINTVNASIGNGSIAGMATAIYAGGPGAAFWVVAFGILLMSIRFLEVYISTDFQKQTTKKSILGGPMLYLRSVTGGNILAFLYALFCFFFGLSIGNAMQSNSVALAVGTTWGVNPYICATVLLAFVVYILFGGAQRVVAASSAIVPIKVGVFLISSVYLLIFHATSLPAALMLILKSAFSSSAIAGGITGFSVMSAVRYGMHRSIMATESGLGTIAILFGYTGSDDAKESGYMGMVGTLISTIICFLVALCIIVSGVWDSGLNSTALTVVAYNTAFGNFGGWIISFLSLTFGIGVIVTYAYISRAAFMYLSNGKYEWIFTVLYSACAFAGALLDVESVWFAGEVFNAGMLFINLYGLAVLLPQYTKQIITN